ncbi:MAG: hypothetical protein R2867_26555 [Caldilineaceae bacterium]
MTELDGDFDNTYFSSAWSTMMQNERAQAFLAAFVQKYDSQPTAVDALTYGAFNLLFSATQHEGGVSPPVRS